MTHQGPTEHVERPRVEPHPPGPEEGRGSKESAQQPPSLRYTQVRRLYLDHYKELLRECLQAMNSGLHTFTVDSGEGP